MHIIFYFTKYEYLFKIYMIESFSEFLDKLKRKTFTTFYSITVYATAVDFRRQCIYRPSTDFPI